MKLSAARQPTGCISRLQQRALGWKVGCQIPRDGNKDVPARPKEGVSSEPVPEVRNSHRATARRDSHFFDFAPLKRAGEAEGGSLERTRP
jgi:hypothetical protein